MKSQPVTNRSGFTLIELMVGLTILVIGVMGAMMYRYSAALDARKADVHVGAGRVALLILEGWKGSAGNASYDPQGVGGLGDEVLGSVSIDVSPASGGIHTVELTGNPAGTRTYYYAELVKPPVDYTNADLDGDGTADTSGMRRLEVRVTYYGKGSDDTSLPAKTVTVAGFVRI